MFHARRFLNDRGGNFAMFGAILSVPLVMAAGVAVDLATITQYKSELQQAIDAAALAVAREGKQISDAAAQDIADTFITNNLDPQFTKLTVNRDGTLVQVKAATRAPMAFGALFGYDEYPVVAGASADVAYASYEIALVLDTTGSMQGGKLIAMKDAVAGLIDTMSGQVQEKDKLKFALVPFSNFVNVGPQYAPKFDAKGKIVKGSGADWLDLHGTVELPQQELVDGLSRFELFENLGVEWAGCVETRQATKKNAYDVDAIEAKPSDKDSLFVPAFHIDEPDSGGFRNSYLVSDADVLDQSKAGMSQKLKKYGLSDAAIGSLLGGVVGLVEDLLTGDDLEPVSIDGTGGKGPNASCVTKPLTPLSNSFSTLKSSVNALTANGTTNIAEGVAWGHRVLSPKPPFTEASPMANGVEKIMIVLTDGANVMGNNNTSLKSSYSSYGFLVDGRLGIAAGGASDTNALMNAKTLAACNLAKDNGITVYTIRLEEPDVATGTMLQECATSPAHYFDAPSRTQLDEVFESIKDRMVKIRIAS